MTFQTTEYDTEQCYLDNAATTFPKPACVLQAAYRCASAYCGNPGRSAHELSMRSAEAVYEARCRLSELLGLSRPENTVFFANATWALNTVLHGVLRRGDRVVTTDIEHNSVIRPLYALRKKGIQTAVLPVCGKHEEEIMELLRRQCRARTRMVVVSHVSNVTGQELPIAQIGAWCRERGILFCVDASQSAGVYPIHMEQMGIDYLCFAGHKALFGLQGSGAAMIAPHAPAPNALAQGGNGMLSLEREMGDQLPEALEAGTVNVPGIVSLGAGARYVAQQTLPHIQSQIFSLYRPLYHYLSACEGVKLYAPSAEKGSVLSFTVRGATPAQIAQHLADRGICVRSGYHCAPLIHRSLGTMENGTVRIGLSALNTQRDVRRFCDGMEVCLSKQ